jgi:hypothetical protein
MRDLEASREDGALAAMRLLQIGRRGTSRRGCARHGRERAGEGGGTGGREHCHQLLRAGTRFLAHACGEASAVASSGSSDTDRAWHASKLDVELEALRRRRPCSSTAP